MKVWSFNGAERENHPRAMRDAPSGLVSSATPLPRRRPGLVSRDFRTLNGRHPRYTATAARTVRGCSLPARRMR
jgi:hypothetical protein